MEKKTKETDLEQLLTKINQQISEYFEQMDKSNKTFADVSKELHQERFCHSKTPLEEAVVGQLISLNFDKAMQRSI